MKATLERMSSRLTERATWRHNVEIASVLLLSIATILTAWSAYQATRWSGVQSKAYNDVSIDRIDASREFTMASQNFSLDSILFAQWVQAYAAGDLDLADFMRERIMVDSFLPVFDEWIASDPLENPNALPNPMSDSTYRERLLAPTLMLEARAESRLEVAMGAYRNIDSYILTTVISAVVFFFAGVAPKFESARLQLILMSCAGLMTLVALANVIRLPVQ